MKSKILIFAIVTSTFANAQSFQSIALKVGAGLAFQIKNPEITNDNNDPQFGYSIGIEPEIIRFGKQHNASITLDALYMKKGGKNTTYFRTFDQNNQLLSIGSMSHPIQLTYFSIAPNIRYNFKQHFYFKGGPRIDFSSGHSFNQLPPGIASPESFYTFENTCFGITYGAGALLGEKKFQFLLELLGQNDFSSSSKNSSTGQSFKNQSYLLNFGLVYNIK